MSEKKIVMTEVGTQNFYALMKKVDEFTKLIGVCKKSEQMQGELKFLLENTWDEIWQS